MQLKDIQNIKTITLSLNYGNNVNSVNALINLEFIPDYVTVKSVSIYDRNNSDDPLVLTRAEQVFQVKSSLITDNTSLFTYPKASSVPISDDGITILQTYPLAASHFLQPKTIFKLYNPVNGLYSFTVLTHTGGPPLNLANFNTTMLLTLEFVKLK